MAVNQKQIAEKLGVSIALVSRVLSGKAAEIGIAPETIERVLKTAEEMGYVPSAAALSLKGKATRTIGVAVYDFNDPFFGTIIKQIQARAHEYDYSLVLAGFLNRNPDEQDLQALHKHSIDGLIVIGTELEAVWLEKFRHLPIARIGHGSEQEPSVRISVDEKIAAHLLVCHLEECGCRQAVYTAADLPAHRIRRQFLEQATDEGTLGLSAESSAGRDAFAAGWEIATKVGTGTDAFICATDQVAMGVLNALHSADIQVPGQVLVTGFDDIPVSEQFIPSITTIRQPLEAMVEEAFNSVIGPAGPRETNLPPKLVIRQST